MSSQPSVTGPHDVQLWLFDPEALECLALQAPKHLPLDEALALGSLAPSQRSLALGRRVALRRALALQRGGEAAAQPLRRLPGGKPALVADAEELGFSMSSSQGWALLALAPGQAVGVDLERHDPALDAAALVRRYFSPGEQAQWQALQGAPRARYVLQVWTRKEALLKWSGLGLRALDGGPPDLEAAYAGTFLQSLELGTAFAAALALEQAPERLWLGRVIGAEAAEKQTSLAVIGD